MLKRRLQSLLNRTHLDAGGKQFGNIHNTVRPRCCRSQAVELGVTLPKLKAAAWLQIFLNHSYDLPSADIAGIGDVVGTERSTTLPQVKTGGNKVATVRQRIEVVIDLRIFLDFGEIIARVIELIEWNAQPPDIALTNTRDGLFAQGFGAAIKAARAIAKTEIGGIL